MMMPRMNAAWYQRLDIVCVFDEIGLGKGGLP